MKILIFSFLTLLSFASSATTINLESGSQAIIQPGQESVKVSCNGKANMICSLKHVGSYVEIHMNNEKAASFDRYNDAVTALSNLIFKDICPSQKSE